MTNDEELTSAEIAEAEAALTLAVVPEGERLPPQVRARIEAGARAFLGERAKAHARTRADARARERQPPLQARSTTSAGAHVVEPASPSIDVPRTRLARFAWPLRALAAAACVALVMASRARVAPAGSVERVSVSGPEGREGELRYDRRLGAVSFTLVKGPAIDAREESLELWIGFGSDATLHPVALLERENETRFCIPDEGRAAAAACAPVREVVVTREPKRGSLVYDERNVVLRSGSR